MKNIKVGLFGLCALIGGYYGSMFGIALAICAFMTLDGLVEEFMKQSRHKNKDEKEGKHANA